MIYVSGFELALANGDTPQFGNTSSTRGTTREIQGRMMGLYDYPDVDSDKVGHNFS